MDWIQRWWELRNAGSVCRGTGVLDEAGAKQGNIWEWMGVSLNCGQRWLWMKRGCNLVTPPPNLQPRLFVVEVGPVGARASRQGLHAQGRLRACWVPSLCHSWARRDKSGNRGAGCLLLVCGALGKPHEIPSWA